MNRVGRVVFVISLAAAAMWSSKTFADDTDNIPPGGPAAVDETHPLYSSDAFWVGSTLVAVGGLFLAATVVGRLVRSESLEVVPTAMSHEEDPAADRAHGSEQK